MNSFVFLTLSLASAYDKQFNKRLLNEWMTEYIRAQSRSCVQLFVTPWIVAHQAPLSMRFSRQEYWSRLPCPPSGDHPDPGIEPVSLGSPTLEVDSLPLVPPGNTFQFSSVESLSCARLFATPWTAAHQAITNSRSLLKLMTMESVMPSSNLILCCPLLLPSIFPSIRVFSNESVLCIRWPKDWSFSFSISPSNEYSGLFSFRIDWFDLQGTLKSLLQHHSSKTSVLRHSAFFMTHIYTWLLEKP